MSETDNSANAAPEVETPSHQWGRFVGYVKRNFHERRAEKKRENPADRAARRTATATVWMAVFTVVLAAVSGGTLLVLKSQLKEMHDGGVDTHNLAVAASDQATWTQRLAGSTGTQADRTKDLADRMKDQADRTKDLADQMKAQADQTKTIAKQAIVEAEAATSAAETAKQSLGAEGEHFAEQSAPILGMMAPPEGQEKSPATVTYLSDTGQVVFSVWYKNYGQSPALRITARSRVILDAKSDRMDDPYVFPSYQFPDDSTVFLPPGEPNFNSAAAGKHVDSVTYQRLLATDCGVTFVMRLEYYDMRGQRYRSEFCQCRLATGASANCQSHNGYERLEATPPAPQKPN